MVLLLNLFLHAPLGGKKLGAIHELINLNRSIPQGKK